MSRIFAFLAGLLVCTVAWAGTVSVSAAISLKEALTEVAGRYQDDTSEKVDLNFGASGTLAAQIVQGAPVDLFISAANKQVDQLVSAGLAEAGSRRDVAGNRLVLIVPKDAHGDPKGFEDLREARFRHIAIGQPQVVPAGQYAMQTFAALGIEKALADRLFMGENVRQVLVYVMRSEAEAGVVYATDAAAAGEAVRVVAVAPDSSHDPIVYPAVAIKNGHIASAQRFLDYLRSPKAQAIFAAHGFTVPEAKR